MKRLLLFWFCASLHCIAAAQSPTTDSLINVLKFAKEDTNKVHLYWEIGKSIIFQNALAAIPFYKKGLSLAQKLHFYHGIEKCYNGTSLAYSYNAQYDSALVYINLALPFAHKAGITKRIALVYINRADVYANLQHYQAALRDCDTALHYTEKERNKKGMGRIYSITSGIYFTQKQFAKAFLANDSAIALFIAAKDDQMVGMSYSDRADFYSQIDQPDKALPFYAKAIEIGEQVNDVENLAAYHNGLAQAHLRKQQYIQAQQNALKAFDYASQTGNRSQQANIYLVMGQIFSKQENHRSSIDFQLKAYEMFKEENDLLRVQIAATALAEEYEKSGDPANAYRYLKISKALGDSLQDMQFHSEIAKIQTQFEVSQKDKEIGLLKKNKLLQHQQLRQQSYLTIGIVVLAALILLGGWLLMNRYRLRQRMKELELRSKIAADLHDDIGSTLSSIRMYSDIVKQQAGQTHTAVELLNKISSNSREMIENMSDIVWMIKPGNDEFASVEDRMLNYANSVCVPAGINFDLTKDAAPDEMRISMEQRRDLYLIFKEAINNAVKYSRCKSIRAIIRTPKNMLQLNISDDGDGFDMANAVKGNGLYNMEKRAASHGGSCVIQSTPNGGTEIIARFII
ncbi:MAG TPA: tetratricopeptide repeat protein [Flavipsychrobacter sp.]|nr:tetratricopeptide repeat protein [Flavipsychrobacter sp.]